jgi:two-component system, chemotaxis family, CheB/CheR fusion protein
MSPSPAPDPEFEALLQFLKRARGFDFTGYKRPSLERRFRRRMELVNCASFAEYSDYLEVQPEEFEQLFDTLLINVTEFFRDPPAWEHLQQVTLPQVLAEKPADEPIRVWSAGCATGQEAFTIAIVLAEILGIDAYQQRVKIYATDIDEEALGRARQAAFSERDLESMPADLRTRYLERTDHHYTLRQDMRPTLIFGRNNLIDDAPISRLDLLVCRNTLMYFNAETQARILRHFHFALRPFGVLMLGKSEMMISHRDQFTPSDLKHRIFRPAAPAADSPPSRLGGLPAPARLGASADDGARLVRDAALNVGPQAQIVVSASGLLSFANLAARTLLGLGDGDIEAPFDEQAIASEPVELRSTVQQVLRERRRIEVGEVEFRPRRGESRRLDVTVLPLVQTDNVVLGALIVFEDVSRVAALEVELESNRRDLEAAYEELQSTIDELETTNEELQSANEELQTTNEELQSTNEELETMNDELQSTNEELERSNDELRERTSELNRVNEFFESVLTSLGSAVTVLDRQQRVLVWNRAAEDLWGLRENEAVEQHFLGLDIGLKTERLAPAVRAVIGGGSKVERVRVDAVNRRGRAILCAATILPLQPVFATDGDSIRGAIVVMEEQRAPEATGTAS